MMTHSAAPTPALAAPPQYTRVGFTGHRKIDTDDPVSRGLEATLTQLAAAGPIVGVCSAASGADTLFLEAATAKGVGCFVILPFPEKRFETDFSPAEWTRVQPLLRSALNIDRLEPSASDEEAYYETGLRTVDESDLLIAVFDETRPPRGTGGTRDIVSYARAIGRRVIVIHPVTGTTSELPPLPFSLANEDAAPPCEVEPTIEEAKVKQLFSELDERARSDAPRTRYLVLRIILLHLFASAIAATSMALHWEGALLAVAGSIKLAALLWALLLGFWHRRAHHGWLEARIDAEWCRSFLAVWRLPRHEEMLPRVALGAESKLPAALRVAWFQDRHAAALPFADARDHYLHCRLLDQMSYYNEHVQSPLRWMPILRWGARSATIGAIIFATIALANTDAHVRGYMKLFSLLLPLLNAALLSVIVTQDFGRRSVRFAQMAEQLTLKARRLMNVRTEPSLRRIVSETETLLLEETTEWQSMLRFGGEH